jgi:hypothetical protein
MTLKQKINWLLDGDISIQYQVYRDLLDKEKPALQKRISSEGWGYQFLKCRQKNGHWGQGFYQPKWISTHYTLLDLKNLNIYPGNKDINKSIQLIFDTEKGPDGGINPIGSVKASDVCINGMLLNYSSYFNTPKENLKSVVDFLLSQKMPDGGFNCFSNRQGAEHSSLHTTLSVLEGISEYEKNGYTYRLKELIKSKKEAIEFILIHKLFRSHRTGEIINPNFLKLYYPGRWYYDILKAMDYFQYANVKYDPRMEESIQRILQKQTKDGLWKLPAAHPGKVHFVMEQAGKPSRWNTLRVMRVLKRYSDSFQKM